MQQRDYLLKEKKEYVTFTGTTRQPRFFPDRYFQIKKRIRNVKKCALKQTWSFCIFKKKKKTVNECTVNK